MLHIASCIDCKISQIGEKEDISTCTICGKKLKPTKFHKGGPATAATFKPHTKIISHRNVPREDLEVKPENGRCELCEEPDINQDWHCVRVDDKHIAICSKCYGRITTVRVKENPWKYE